MLGFYFFVIFCHSSLTENSPRPAIWTRSSLGSCRDYVESKIEMESSWSLFCSNAAGEACNPSALQSLEAVQTRAEVERADLYKSNRAPAQMLVTSEFRSFWLKACLQPELSTECTSVDLADRANEDFSRISRYLKKLGQACPGR